MEKNKCYESKEQREFLFLRFSTSENTGLSRPSNYAAATAARPTLSQLWCLIISRTTFLGYIKFVYLLILRL